VRWDPAWSHNINQHVDQPEATSRVAIIGSRSYPRPDLVAVFVATLPEDAVIVSGGARGADIFAENAARARGLETLIFPADWENLGRRAGPIRNQQIIDHADSVVAFWDGRSRGTLHSLALARRANLPIQVFGPDGAPIDLGDALGFAEEHEVFEAIAARERAGGTRGVG
jgi:hypothetical protein